MDLEQLYAHHVAECLDRCNKALIGAAEAGHEYQGIVFHAGTQGHYHADDRHIAFHPTPHFARLVPLPGPGHLLLVKPGEKPVLYAVVPEDFWYEPPAEPPVQVGDHFDVRQVANLDEAGAHIGKLSGWAYVGDDPKLATSLGIAGEAVEPKALMTRLDWHRGAKTPYEVECIREAGRIAGQGHAAVREAMAEGLSERELHFRYLLATNQLDDETPYTGIIGWDRNAAVLHYQTKSSERPDPGQVLLIDAGATCNGYASDITRTWLRDAEQVHPTFQALLDRMDRMQRDLVAQVKPGLPYPELHDLAHQRIAGLLSEAGVFRCSGEEAYEQQLTTPFLPHGLGHHIGVQVHDVAGWQQDEAGTVVEPPQKYPFLRTTRTLEEGHVVTIEPGLYFIPMLLDPIRSAEKGKQVDWSLVDELIPCGGIRIEDDVLVTAGGAEDLTRPSIAQ